MPGRGLGPFFLRPPSARRPANCRLLRELPATEPQNLQTAHPGGSEAAEARQPGRLGQGQPEFEATRRSRPAPPPGAHVGPAPRPPQRHLGLPRPVRGSSPGARPPHARGAPRASPRPSPAASNPTARHPRRARPASHPQSSAARSPEPDPIARALYRLLAGGLRGNRGTGSPSGNRTAASCKARNGSTPRFHWPVDSAERDTQLRGRDVLPLCFLQKKCESKERDS